MNKYYFIFCKDSLLLSQADNATGHTIPYAEEPPIAPKPWTQVLDIGPMEDGSAVVAYNTDTPTVPPGHDELAFCPLRQSYYKLPRELYLKAGKCAELLYWNRNTQFCGVCGAPMKMHTSISKRCTQCGKEVWPQLATAVIVLIRRGHDEIFLAKGRNFKTNFYGLIAGFVETGETLEQAVEREVMEETGMEICNLRYFGSQPWPYPSGLMVGFTADYSSGEVRLQKEEIVKGQWFRRDNLPNLPEKLSIARMLIDSWIEEKKQ